MLIYNNLAAVFLKLCKFIKKLILLHSDGVFFVIPFLSLKYFDIIKHQWVLDNNILKGSPFGSSK